MADIVLTPALRNNLLSLQNTQRLIDVTQQRLATGLKVNSALDSPQNFFAAQALNNRAGDLGRLLDGISQSIRTIEEADNGITALTTLVGQAESIADSAQAEVRAAEGFAFIRGTKDLSTVEDLTASGDIANGDDIQITFVSEDDGVIVGGSINIATGDNIYDVVAAINSDATNSINDYVQASVDAQGRLKIESLEEGGLIKIDDGTTSPGADGFAFLGLDGYVGAENNVAATRYGGVAVAGRVLKSVVTGGTAVNGAYEASDTLDTANYVATGDTVGFEIIIDGTTSGEIAVAATATIQELLDGINNNASVNQLVTATFDTTDGQIVFEFADSVGQAEIQINAQAASDDTSFGFGTGASDLTGAGAAGTDATSELFTFTGTSASLAQFEEDFNNIRSQIDALVEDAGYRGVSLLNGDDLTTYFNEDRSNTLVTEGTDFTAAGLGINEVAFTDSLDVQTALDEVRAALTAIRDFGSSVANDLAVIQTRRDFVESTINTLEAGADDLTIADSNEEGANLLALQTRQALGTTALSLASQSAQSVLRLF